MLLADSKDFIIRLVLSKANGHFGVAGGAIRRECGMRIRRNLYSCCFGRKIGGRQHGHISKWRKSDKSGKKNLIVQWRVKKKCWILQLIQ